MALVKKEVGELLVENGLITPEEWKSVQVEREKTGEPISLILSRLGLATESQVKNALELQYGVNFLSLNKAEPPTSECLNLLPEAVMRQHQFVPIMKDGNRVTLAMVNPNNLAALDDIKVRLKGMNIKLSVCTEDDFQSFMETTYSQHLVEQLQFADQGAQSFIDQEVDLSQMDILADSGEDLSERDLEEQAGDAPIVLLANQILAKAIKGKISDIHIEPHEKEVAIRYRRDGVLNLDRRLPKPILPALVSRFKIMADLDIAERRQPQDGRIRVRLSGKDIDFRVSTLPAKFGEKVVMRILDKSNTSIGLNKLITDAEAMETIIDMIKKPFGIIFVTGPTGSGKTTTLYSALAERNTPDVNIVTAEDPIEYDMSGITQVQVIREKGMDFARILRAFLRQDPDIMLVGETRDKETAKIAVEAALTGHLVFTTLHTNDAPGAVSRLEEMEVEPFLISSATIGIIAQRLVRKICSECQEEYLPDRNLLEYLGLLEGSQEALADSTIQFYRFRVNKKGWPIFIRGKGCDNCNGSGYRGRVGVYEVMRFNDEIRDLISKHASTAMLRFAAKQSGMIPLKEYSLRLVGAGLTSPEECIRVTISDTGGEDKLCPKCRNPIGDDFIRCPFCQHELKVSCVRCGMLQEDTWAACAKCGLSREEAQLDHVCCGCKAEVFGTWNRCPYCQTERQYDVQKVEILQENQANGS
ncbi:MAG: Flp pilus assembly complex ATPase component TadA [Candidatus Obscuribacterales bacterium]|nr:Flp pilus assembly complex ATPase component TadA [Candidatus Obscuribacterales bacterium]